MAIMSRLRNLRHSHFARVRHQRRQLAFLAATATRLLSSASAQTVATVNVANTDATGTLTFGANAGNGKIVTIGSRVYTFKTALTEVKASGTYTVGGGGSVIQDNDTLILNGKTYTWQTSLTNVDGHVLIGVNDTAALLNMLRAITLGAGSGTLYAAATTAHPTMTATASAATTLTVKALSVGTAGNALTTTESSAGSFGAVTLTGGVDAIVDEVKVSGVDASGSLDALIAALNASGAGTVYSTGTVVNADVSAAAGAGDTMDVTAKAHGTTGNLVATSTDVASGSWGGSHLSGGVTAAFGPTFTATTHGISDGEGPYVMTSSNGASHIPAGVSSGQLIWVANISASVLAFGRTREAAIRGEYIPFTDAGTGTISITKAMTSEGIFETLRRARPETIVAATDIDSLN